MACRQLADVDRRPQHTTSGDRPDAIDARGQHSCAKPGLEQMPSDVWTILAKYFDDVTAFRLLGVSRRINRQVKVGLKGWVLIRFFLCGPRLSN